MPDKRGSTIESLKGEKIYQDSLAKRETNRHKVLLREARPRRPEKKIFSAIELVVYYTIWVDYKTVIPFSFCAKGDPIKSSIILYNYNKIIILFYLLILFKMVTGVDKCSYNYTLPNSFSYRLRCRWA